MLWSGARLRHKASAWSVLNIAALFALGHAGGIDELLIVQKRLRVDGRAADDARNAEQKGVRRRGFKRNAQAFCVRQLACREGQAQSLAPVRERRLLPRALRFGTAASIKPTQLSWSRLFLLNDRFSGWVTWVPAGEGGVVVEPDGLDGPCAPGV